MKYSNKVDLKEVLKRAPEYVILRARPEFPNYCQGQDINILCKDLGKMRYYLCCYFTGNTLKVHIRPNHIHIDCMIDGKIDLRFDLYGEVVSKQFTKEVLDTAYPVIFYGYKFFLPQAEYNYMLKCYEWIYNKNKKYKEFAKYTDLLKKYE